jgi:uncharacterized protein YukE
MADAGTALVNNAPLYSDGKAVVKAASNGDIMSLGADVGSFAMSAAGDAADPLNALISAGLGFLEDWCTPVKDCLAQVTGKPEELDKNKEAFGEVSKDIAKLSEDLENITKNGFQNWNGDAKDAATKAIDTFVQGVNGTANNATDIATLLGISATLMDAAKEIINGILSTLIEWLIVTWVAALAASFFTFGASDAAATAATGVEASVEGANAADKVEETGSFIERIVNIIKSIIEKLKGFAKEVSKNHSMLKDGKEVLGKDAGKAGEDAGKAGEDAGKAGEDAGKAGDEKTAPSDSGESGGSGNSEDKPNFFQNKYNEAKEGLQHPIQSLQENATGRSGQNAWQYLTTPGEHGPSKLGDTFADAGLKGGAKIVGGADDGALDQENGPDGWGSQSGTIDQDLQG